MLMPDLGAAFSNPADDAGFLVVPDTTSGPSNGPKGPSFNVQQSKIRIPRKTLGPNYSESNFAESLVGFKVQGAAGALGDEEAETGEVIAYDAMSRLYDIEWDWGNENMARDELQPLLLPKSESDLWRSFKDTVERTVADWEENVERNPVTLPSAAPRSEREAKREPIGKRMRDSLPSSGNENGWEVEDITSDSFQWWNYSEYEDVSDTEEDRIAMEGPEDEGGSIALDCIKLNDRGFQRWWMAQKQRWVMVRDTRAFQKMAKEAGEETMRYRWSPFEMYCSEQREKLLVAENVDAVQGVNDEPAPGWHKEVVWRKDGSKGGEPALRTHPTRLESPHESTPSAVTLMSLLQYMPVSLP